MKIIKVEKVTIDLIKVFNLDINDELYSLELDGNNIGYGIIREDINKKLEIYILSEHQGRGYGTKLFGELLNIINKEVIVQVNINNIIMRKILMKYSAIEIGRNGEDIRYVIPNKGEL